MKNWVFATIVGLVVVLAACAPKTADTPALTPLVPQVVPIAPTIPVATAPGPEEAAWTKVVEAAKKEGRLTLYSYNMVGDIGLTVAEAFRKKYAIDVDIITGRGAEFLERVKTEKRVGQIVGDAHDGSSSHAISMKNERLTVSLAELPVFREKGVWRVDPFTLDSQDRNVASLNFIHYSPWVNTRQVKAGEEPKVWKDLLKPQWKGKMILTDPFTSGGPEKYFVPLIREKAIDEEFLKALYKQDLSFASSLQEEARLLSAGERLLSIRGSDGSYARYVVQGAPIKAIDMEDGIVLTASPVLAAFANSPHPNAAKLFINWLLSKDGIVIWSQAASNAGIRKDVMDYRPEAARLTPKHPIVMTEEDNDESVRLFRGRWLPKLWGRR